MNRCSQCNGLLEIARPQIGDQEAVCRCVHCGALILMDSQPSAPASLPAGCMRVWVIPPSVPAVWLN